MTSEALDCTMSDKWVLCKPRTMFTHPQARKQQVAITFLFLVNLKEKKKIIIISFNSFVSFAFHILLCLPVKVNQVPFVSLSQNNLTIAQSYLQIIDVDEKQRLATHKTIVFVSVCALIHVQWDSFPLSNCHILECIDVFFSYSLFWNEVFFSF